jgi:hypothetical protein
MQGIRFRKTLCPCWMRSDAIPRVRLARFKSLDCGCDPSAIHRHHRHRLWTNASKGWIRDTTLSRRQIQATKIPRIRANSSLQPQIAGNKNDAGGGVVVVGWGRQLHAPADLCRCGGLTDGAEAAGIAVREMGRDALKRITARRQARDWPAE